jgi:hypothetical protein
MHGIKSRVKEYLPGFSKYNIFGKALITTQQGFVLRIMLRIQQDLFRKEI